MNREAMTTTIQKLDQSTTPASSIPKVIVRAEPTLARILKTLDADYVKVQVRWCNLLSALGHCLLFYNEEYTYIITASVYLICVCLFFS
jgi:hypothetical protein